MDPRRMMRDRSARFPHLAIVVIAAVLVEARGWALVDGSWVNFTNGDRVGSVGGLAATLWVATNGGIVALDKTSGLRTFYTRANSGLTGNYVATLHAAADGELWVLQNDHSGRRGLLQFDGLSWTMYEHDSPALPFPPVRMLTDNLGALWIQAAWDPDHGRIARRVGSEWCVTETATGLEGWYVSAVAREGQSNLWLAVFPTYYFHEWHHGGLACYDGLGWRSFTFADSSLTSNFITSLAIDLDGSLWVAYAPQYGASTGDRGGVSRFDGSTWTHFRSDNSGIPTEQVRSLAIDSEGRKWLGTDAGVVSYDGGQWTVFDRSNSDLPSDDILHLYVDAANEVWAGTRDAGLARLRNGAWLVYDTSNSPFPFSHQNQFSVPVMKPDRQGNMWMGLFQDGGLLEIAGDIWRQYDTSSSPLPSDHVFDIAFDLQNTLWVATPSGLAAFDGVAWRIFDASNSELRQDYAYRVAVDPLSGDIWVGNQLGLAKYDGENWTHYDTGNSGLPSNYIEALAFDAGGILHVSTRNPGNFGIVGRFDGTIWSEIFRTSVEVPSSFVFDPEGNLWANWPGGGVARFDGVQLAFYNTGNSGLPDNHVSSLTHDGRALWIGTYGGLARFDGQAWQVFDVTNSGIAQNVVNSVAVGTDGRVWIGSGGLSICSCGSTPTLVVVEDLQAVGVVGTIQLSWNLRGSMASLASVEIERALAPGGPYVRLNPDDLAPDTAMAYEDSEVVPGETYWYRLVLLELDGARTVTAPVAASCTGVRQRAALRVLLPSPDGSVTLRYWIGNPTRRVLLQVFDVTGRHVTTFEEGARAAGEYERPWRGFDGSGRRVARGLYIARLVSGNETISCKLLLVR